MRQAGIIAAGALYALEHNIPRLAEDHANAQIFADSVRATEGLTLTTDTVDTNMVIFEVDPAIATAQELAELLGQAGVLVLTMGPTRVRVVTHLDVTEEDMHQAGRILRKVIRRAKS
jgi:threonine aldolase